MPAEPLTICHLDELETNGSWGLVRRTLGVSAFGLNVVDIAAGASIPEHDETGRDQEEVAPASLIPSWRICPVLSSL